MFPHNRSPLNKEMTKRPRLPPFSFFPSSPHAHFFFSYFYFIELSSGSLWVFDFNVFIVIKIDYLAVWFRMGYCIYYPYPPGSGLTFSSYPWRLAKIAVTSEDFQKIWVYPWRIGSYRWKKSSIFMTYPWGIPWFLNQRGGDIKCNSPVVLLGVRAWADPRFVSFSGFNFLNVRRASLSISQEKNRTSLRPGY